MCKKVFDAKDAGRTKKLNKKLKNIYYINGGTQERKINFVNNFLNSFINVSTQEFLRKYLTNLFSYTT